MSRELSAGRRRAWWSELSLSGPLSLVGLLYPATAATWLWTVALAVCLGGGVAAGLHTPVSGAWFWHLANGGLIAKRGLGAGALYLARAGAPLDLRGWLVDLATYLLYKGGGLDALTLGGALAGAVLGVLLFLAARIRRATSPLALVLAVGLGLGALAPVLPDLSAEVLALLSALLLLALGAAQRWRRAGPALVLLLVVAWVNLQPDAAVAVLLIWGWVVATHVPWARDRGLPRSSWWLIPISLVGLLASPLGLGALTALPLSLGQSGEHPLLPAWSSIDFHPWSARWSELVALLLLLSYWLAGRRLRPGDAYLGFAAALLALLWSNYLALFLVVATVQSGWYLSEAWRAHAESTATGPRSRPRRLLRPAAALCLVATVALLLFSVATVVRRGGVEGQVRSALPVAAAGWLAAHPVSGAWFTTPRFGDYLSARFPLGRHLVCSDDPLPLAGQPLQRCEALAVLNAGALRTLASLHPTLALLPRAAPAAAYLLAAGWKIRYRDSTAVVLFPSES